MNDWIDPILENLKHNKLLWAEDKVTERYSVKEYSVKIWLVSPAP